MFRIVSMVQASNQLYLYAVREDKAPFLFLLRRHPYGAHSRLRRPCERRFCPLFGLETGG